MKKKKISQKQKGTTLDDFGKFQHIWIIKGAKIKRFAIGKVGFREKAQHVTGQYPRKIKSFEYVFTQKALKIISV